MRTTELYQIYDKIAEAVVGPIMSANRAAPIIRSFYELLADERRELNKHAADYDLLHIATQDEETGEILAFRPETTATGAAWLAAKTNREETDK